MTDSEDAPERTKAPERGCCPCGKKIGIRARHCADCDMILIHEGEAALIRHWEGSDVLPRSEVEETVREALEYHLSQIRVDDEPNISHLESAKGLLRSLLDEEETHD